MNDENLKKGKKFSSEYQPSNEAKSNGQIEASKKKNLLETLRSRIEEWDLIDKVVNGVDEEIGNGNFKNAIELIKIAKEPETQNINLTNTIPKIVVENDKDAETINKIMNVKAN